MLPLLRGLITSIQGFSEAATLELAAHALNGGAIGIRTTEYGIKKYIEDPKIAIIGLVKNEVNNKYAEPYITNTLADVQALNGECDYIAIDYRKCNTKLEEISWYCAYHKLGVIADIRNVEDYINILENGYYYDYIATTFSVFDKSPNFKLIKDIKAINDEELIIAEGGIYREMDVVTMKEYGAHSVCIGEAIFGIENSVYGYSRCFMEGYCGNPAIDHGWEEEWCS